jgi:ABC-2 type transport system ATP-binding protein
MLSVNHLTKRYRNVLANDDLCFTAGPGEATLLVGPNGAGKSTAIKCIAGLLRFDGEILIAGHKNKSVEAKRVFGYIPEIPAPYDLLTVEEHLEFVGRAYRAADWEARADALLARMELDDKRKKLGKELSKGMQQKLSICCALLPAPSVVLFDEPLVGLDPHAIKELKAMIAELKAAGAAVVISTHMLDSVREFWDKTLIMMGGRIVAERTRAEIERTGEDLEALFFSITEGSKAEAAR